MRAFGEFDVGFPDIPVFGKHSRSVNIPTQTIMLEMKDLRVQYDALEQTARILHLENEEYSKELIKMKKENEELKYNHKSLAQQHTEIYDTKQSMANVLSYKSKAWDDTHATIQQLRSQLLQQTQTSKRLSVENDSLIQENKSYQHCLLESATKHEEYKKQCFEEKQEYEKQIESLTHNKEELQHQLDMFSAPSISPTRTPMPDEECKANADDHGIGGYGKGKTVRFQLDLSSNCSNDDMAKAKIFGHGRKYSVKSLHSTMSGVSYMGITDLGSNKSQYTAELLPLIGNDIHLVQSETYGVDGGTLHDHDIDGHLPFGYDAAAMLFHNKMDQLVSQYQSDLVDLNEKYDKLENEHNQQKNKLDKTANTIEKLRQKNKELKNRLSGSCLFNLFSLH